jgi:hypothetical protein
MTSLNGEQTMSTSQVMMNIDPSLIERALLGGIEVELSDLISNGYLCADAALQNEPLQYLHDELAGHRLRLYKEYERWFLAPFDE